MIDVTAAIIRRNGKILIAKRSSTSSLPNKWEFPGGKIDDGETPKECLKRELQEEFDIIVDVGDYLTESVYQYEQRTIRLIAFHVNTEADFATLNAHDDVRWVPAEELLDYDLAPADVPIAKEVQRRVW
jgi:8-oxo-dGTP diphosphatase